MIGSHVPRLAAVIAGTLAMPAPAVCGDDEIDVLAWPQELQYGTRDSAGITIPEFGGALARRLAHSRQFREWQGCHLRPQRHPRAHHDPARGGRHSHETAG